jgi:hypothetical protein
MARGHRIERCLDICEPNILQTAAAKVALALKLRQETTMTMSQIAHRLRMGTRSTLNTKLHPWRRTHEEEGE